MAIFVFSVTIRQEHAGQGIEMGDPGEKTVPRMVKFRKQRFRFKHVIFKRFHIKRNKMFKDFKQWFLFKECFHYANQLSLLL
jgi:hypothetical protein